MTDEITRRPSGARLRVGAFSGFYGDSPDNMSTLLDDGVDVLIGDYLAELTMLILRKNEMRGGQGYAHTFVAQLRANAQKIASHRVKVIANAGGLDPDNCAARIREMLREQGVDLTVAAISGDDLREGLAERLGSGGVLVNIDTGEHLRLDDHDILTANAYLGAWPIVKALNAGADIVVCPRMTDASLVVGPVAWYFGWAETDWDRLAAGVVAGHVIECGGQATGGNFSRFHEFEDLGHPGLPIAEIADDGTCVITKTRDSGGIVTVDTVKAQLFYEVGEADYHNPDVLTSLTSIALREVGADRVEISGVRGRPPTTTTKLSLTYEGGYRNSMTIGLTGRRIADKVAWLRRQVEERVGGADHFDGYRFSLIGPAKEGDGTYDESTAFAVFSVRDRDASKVNRPNFADRIVQICLASIPGFYMTTPPSKERLYGVQWPCLIEKRLVTPIVRIEGSADVTVPWGVTGEHEGEGEDTTAVVHEPASSPAGPAVRLPLGDVAATRSGDKGGKANIGVWVDTPAQYAWLTGYLTIEKLAELMPEVRGLRLERFEFPNLRGLNFLIYGYLEDGVSSCLRVDAQAKGLGEYLASKTVEVPRSVLRVAS